MSQPIEVDKEDLLNWYKSYDMLFAAACFKQPDDAPRLHIMRDELVGVIIQAFQVTDQAGLDKVLHTIH